MADETKRSCSFLLMARIVKGCQTVSIEYLLCLPGFSAFTYLCRAESQHQKVAPTDATANSLTVLGQAEHYSTRLAPAWLA